MARNIPFTLHEAVLLLDAYLQTLSGEVSRKDAVSNCSAALRRMGAANGIQIDDKYRNENGINFQMSSMETAYGLNKTFVSAPKLFNKTVEMYKNDRDKYEKSLKEARQMAGIRQDDGADFFNWLSKQVSAAQLSELYMTFQEIEGNAKNLYMIKNSLFENMSESLFVEIKNKLQYKILPRYRLNVINAALNYLIRYVRENQIEPAPVCEEEKFEQQAESSSYNNYSPEPEPNPTALRQIKTVDFVDIPDMRFTNPVSLTYFGERKEIYSWRGLYADLCNMLIDDYLDEFDEMLEKSLTGSAVPWITDEEFKRLLREPRAIKHGLYIEVNHNITEIIRNIRRILDYCKVSYDNVIIEYGKREDAPPQNASQLNPTESHTGKSSFENNSHNTYKADAQPAHDIKTVNFANIPDMTFTKPLSFTYFGERNEFGSWGKLYVAVCNALAEDYPVRFREMFYDSIGGRTALWIADEEFKHRMHTPVQITGGYYIETNRGAQHLVKNIKMILDRCLVDYDNVQIEYVKRGETMPQTAQTQDSADERSFYTWLKDVEKMAESTCKSYVSAILNVERYAQNNGYTNTKLFDSDSTEVLELAGALFMNEDFVARNRVLKDQPRTALTKLLKYYGIDWTERKRAEANANNASQSTESDIKILDYVGMPDVSFTKPVALTYFGERREFNSWRNLYIELCNALIEKYPSEFNKMLNENLTGNSALWLVDEEFKDFLREPKAVKGGYYIETHYNVFNIIKNIRRILDRCKVSYDDVVIEYVKKGETLPQAGQAQGNSDIQSFYTWLKDVEQLAEVTCRNYVTNITKIERYAQSNGYQKSRFFGQSAGDVFDLANALFRDEDFVANNKRLHNQPRAAITKLLKYYGIDWTPARGRKMSLQPVRDNAPIEVDEDIVAVLKRHYKYGFKYNSIRELIRFRQFADEMNITLPEEDDILKKRITDSGTIIDNKVYCQNDDLRQALQKMIDEIFSQGANLIYYESLFEKEREWMESNFITSSHMLQEYIQKNIGGYNFAKKYIYNGEWQSEKQAVSREMQRIWGQRPVRSVESLGERLPYIPLENIARFISGNSLFVWNSQGEYALVERFIISSDQEDDILEFVDEQCEQKGFASLSDIPLEDLEEENYELSQNAILYSVYNKVLAGKYQLNGKILTKESCDLDVLALLKQYIKDKDECRFDEVADRVFELVGTRNRGNAFKALYDDMVRVDKDRFVSERLVSFDTDAIDSILSEFMNDNFMPIKDVTTFAMFPVCGQSWNHYLLESFCYKYSKKYNLNVIHFNDKNAGIISKNGYNATYDEMLAAALAKSDIELTPDNSGKYLFNTGYTAKSKYSKLDEINQRAMELRGGE